MEEVVIVLKWEYFNGLGLSNLNSVSSESSVTHHQMKGSSPPECNRFKNKVIKSLYPVVVDLGDVCRAVKRRVFNMRS